MTASSFSPLPRFPHLIKEVESPSDAPFDCTSWSGRGCRAVCVSVKHENLGGIFVGYFKNVSLI